MLKKDFRLKKKRDFNLIIKNGQWQNGRLFSLKVLKLDEITDLFPKREDPEKFKNQLKIAVVVGVKVSKSAVKRNAIKRKMREVVRLLVKEPGVKTGYYIMINAKPAVLGVDYAEISQEINFLFKKADLLIN